MKRALGIDAYTSAAQIFIRDLKRLIAETTCLVRHQRSSSATHVLEFREQGGADRDTTRQFFLLAHECPYRKKDMLPTPPFSPRHIHGGVRENGMGYDLQSPRFVGAECIAFHGTTVDLCRNSRSESTVRAPSIVVTNPFRQEPTEMLLVQWDHEIQTLASHGPDQSFTKCIRLRRLRRSFQDLHTETLD
jgi:hypothetical protein